MLIDGINPIVYGVTSYNKEIGLAEVTTYDDWLRQSINPTLVGQKETWKVIDLSFFLRGATEDIITANISNLANSLKRCIIQFDGLSFYYSCILETTKVIKHSQLQQVLEVTLKSSYGYKAPVTDILTHLNSKVVTVLGNLSTAAIVTVTAPVDTISVVLTGLGSNITIKNLKANIPVVIDGESCTVISNGLNKFLDTDMWGFPVLQPGANTVGINSTSCIVNISYKPKYT